MKYQEISQIPEEIKNNLTLAWNSNKTAQYEEYPQGWAGSPYFHTVVQKIYQKVLRRLDNRSVKLGQWGVPMASDILPPSLSDEKLTDTWNIFDVLISYPNSVKEELTTAYRRTPIGNNRVIWVKQEDAETRFFQEPYLADAEVRKILEILRGMSDVIGDLSEEVSNEDIIEDLEVNVPIEDWPEEERRRSEKEEMDMLTNVIDTPPEDPLKEKWGPSLNTQYVNIMHLSGDQKSTLLKQAQTDSEFLPNLDIAFGDEEEEFQEPEEGDLVTYDHIKFYEAYGGGLKLKPALEIHDPEDPHTPVDDNTMWVALQQYMDKQQFWPNVWFISDHGNAHLMTRK